MEMWGGSGPAIASPTDLDDFIPKNATGQDMEKMVDGTLFRCVYLPSRNEYRVSSYTPVEGRNKPLNLNQLIRRVDAEDHAQNNFMNGLSTDTAALALGIEKLSPQIPYQLRKLREGEIVQEELEDLEGFGSF